MGLDIGEVRIGVALTDPLKISAQPFCTLDRKDKSKCIFATLEQMISENDVEIVVAGLPIGMDGTETEQTQKIRDFTTTLIEKTSLKTTNLVLQDERLTSIEAERILVDKKLKNKDRRAAIDRMAASIILQAYLNSQSHL